MDEMNTVYRNVIRISWIIIFAVSVILVLVNVVFFKDELWYKFMLSYLLGAMTNLFAFNLLRNSIAALDDDKKRVMTNTMTNYAIRFMIYGFILFFSFRNNRLNPYIVASGFFTVKLSIYLYQLTSKKVKVVKSDGTDDQ